MNPTMQKPPGVCSSFGRHSVWLLMLSFLLISLGAMAQSSSSNQGATEVLANFSVGAVLLIALGLSILRFVLIPMRSPAARSVAELSESLIIAGIAVFLIIRPFLLQAFFIPSESMEPTLLVHDHLFVNKLAYRLGNPQHEEIAVFRAPKEADIEGNHQNENVLIKRIIGVPGDTLQVKKDPADHQMKVWRNGKPLAEPFINEPLSDPQSDAARFAEEAPLKLEKDQYFVMGDNRNHSNDSRFWGILERKRMIGRAMFKFWPLNRIGIIR